MAPKKRNIKKRKSADVLAKKRVRKELLAIDKIEAMSVAKENLEDHYIKMKCRLAAEKEERQNVQIQLQKLATVSNESDFLFEQKIIDLSKELKLLIEEKEHINDDLKNEMGNVVGIYFDKINRIKRKQTKFIDELYRCSKAVDDQVMRHELACVLADVEELQLDCRDFEAVRQSVLAAESDLCVRLIDEFEQLRTECYDALNNQKQDFAKQCSIVLMQAQDCFNMLIAEMKSAIKLRQQEREEKNTVIVRGLRKKIQLLEKHNRALDRRTGKLKIYIMEQKRKIATMSIHKSQMKNVELKRSGIVEFLKNDSALNLIKRHSSLRKSYFPPVSTTFEKRKTVDRKKASAIDYLSEKLEDDSDKLKSSRYLEGELAKMTMQIQNLKLRKAGRCDPSLKHTELEDRSATMSVDELQILLANINLKCEELEGYVNCYPKKNIVSQKSVDRRIKKHTQ